MIDLKVCQHSHKWDSNPCPHHPKKYVGIESQQYLHVVQIRLLSLRISELIQANLFGANRAIFDWYTSRQKKFQGNVKRPKNSTIKPLSGGGGNGKKRPKSSKNHRKIVLLSLYLLYLYLVWKSKGGVAPLPTPKYTSACF